MKRVFVVLLHLLVFCASYNLLAKENKDLDRANYYYEHYAYHEAIPFFEKVADQLHDATTYTRTGDCYRLTNNIQKAREWYAKAVKVPGYKVEMLMHYGQVLMALEQYGEAEKWLKIYQKYNKGDKRVANLLSGCALDEKKQNAIPAGTATLAECNTNGSEFAPTLWKGKLVFSSDSAVLTRKKTDKWSGNAYFSIYSVSYDTSGHCGTEYNEITDAKNVNIQYHDGPCTFSADGSNMYFTRTRYKNKFLGRKSVANDDMVVLLEIMMATGYNEQDKTFKTITPFPYNSEKYSVAHPAVSPNGMMLVFASNMPKGYGGCDLYMCRKNGSGWSQPQNLGKNINTEGDELFPYFADNNTLCFSSDGHEGRGGLDIYVSRWNEKMRSFSTPEDLPVPLNSPFDDISLALFADGRSTFFSSNRPASKGGDNIYYFKRHQAFLDLDIIDSITQKPIAAAMVNLTAEQDQRGMSGDDGGHLFTPVYTEAQYTVSCKKAGYRPGSVNLNTTVAGEVDTFKLTVALAPDTPPVIAATPPKFEVNKVYKLTNFNYEVDEYTLDGLKKAKLDTLAGEMSRRPGMEIRVQAHTDCRATTEYNQELSDRRAAEVVKYLVHKGISPKRLQSVGYGEMRPIVSCQICEACPEEVHYQNRVVEFVVLHM